MEASFMLETAAYLGTEDVARWQAVDVTAKGTFVSKGDINVWKTCAENEFPELDAEVELYTGNCRTSFLRCHGLLLRANYELGSMLIIGDIDDAALLEGQLRKGFRSCKSHLARSGRDAHVLLGGFGLKKSSGPTLFRFGSDGKPFIAGLPAGVLELKLCFDGGRLMTSARYGTGNGFPFEPCVEANRVQLKLNVASVHRSMNLCFREVPVTLDGRWRHSSMGMCHGHSTCSSMFGYPDQTVLCVVTLLDAEVPNRFSAMPLAVALNLDVHSTSLSLRRAS
eukprot:TRINITY_DN10444_c0_g1_i1.p1 TRINITY_DN10444_c0_g1~~TRINITY_DN10444_c0_g1_i1.p1  ORF type:complete len:299 (+),score=28.32 TRINITY_DN10444_c0_g1_i1:56-898(+)